MDVPASWAPKTSSFFDDPKTSSFVSTLADTYSVDSPIEVVPSVSAATAPTGNRKTKRRIKEKTLKFILLHHLTSLQ